MNKEYRYSGIVVEKGIEGPTSGYKTQTDTKYFVIYREEKTNQCIRVNTTIPCYYSLNKGQRVSFTLSNREMNNLGNTTTKTKNLYGE